MTKPRKPDIPLDGCVVRKAKSNVRRPRVEVSYDAFITTLDGHKSIAIVQDLSAQGFRLQVDEELIVGEVVKLIVPKQSPIAGEIRWVKGNEAGGAFL